MTERERKAATKFRNDLLELGYLMLQYSVYARCAVTLERKPGLIRQLKRIAPTTGNVHVFFLTDAQWAKSIVISKSEKEINLPKNNHLTEQLQFW